MKELSIYLAETGICISAFLLIYKLFLQYSTFFKFNRFYLLTGLVLSFIVPLVEFKYDILLEATSVQTPVQAELPVEVNTYSAINIWGILAVIYGLGILSRITSNLIRVIRLVRIIKTGNEIHLKGYKLIQNQNISSPFTVWNYIVLNIHKLSDTEKNLILEHETIHIKQRHWIDLICSECALILQWFNPFIWLYVSSLKENHEFLADKAVIEKGYSSAVYQAVLINQRFEGPVFSFANSFNYSNHLKRINMIKKEKSASWKKISILILIPVFGVFFWVSAKPNYIINYTVTKPSHMTHLANDNDLMDSVKIIGYGSNNGATVVGHNSTNVIRIQKNSDIPNPPLILVDDKEVSEDYLQKIDPDKISVVEVLKDNNDAHKSVIDKYGEKAKNGVIKITLKKPSDNNENVTTSTTIYNGLFNGADFPVVFIDGKESSMEEFKKLDVKIVKSVMVSKDEDAVKRYGDKAKNGIILVETYALYPILSD